MNITIVPVVIALVASSGPSAALADDRSRGFLYGKVVTTEGERYQGRLRFGGDEEAFWNHYFIGRKAGNRWADYVKPARLAESRPVKLLGMELGTRKRLPDPRRPLMVAFGNIQRLEAAGRELSVTLRNGTRYKLDRYEADDYADGLRVWDEKSGVANLDEWSIRRIEFMPAPALANIPQRLQGTVRTSQGEYIGTIQWNRDAATSDDLLRGQVDGKAETIAFGEVMRIERMSGAGARVTLRDSRQLLLSGGPDVGPENRGIDVDDPRFGRVSISWDTLLHADFRLVASGPGYQDFAPGQPLHGTVETRDGQRRSGRLIFDLDESETTDTLDAPAGPLHHTIPFSLLTAIELGGGEADAAVQITLRSGQQLTLDAAGDLGEDNAGLLVFGTAEEPEYLDWAAVKSIHFDWPD